MAAGGSDHPEHQPRGRHTVMLVDDALGSVVTWVVCAFLREAARFLSVHKAARWFRRGQRAVLVGGVMDVIYDELVGIMAQPPRAIALPLALVAVMAHLVALVALGAGVIELIGGIGPRWRQRRRSPATVRSRPVIAGSVTVAPSRA